MHAIVSYERELPSNLDDEVTIVDEHSSGGDVARPPHTRRSCSALATQLASGRVPHLDAEGLAGARRNS
jgi:hypothetical protein